MTVETIKSLNDTRVRQIPDSIARHQIATASTVELTPVLRHQLAAAFDLTNAPVPSASEAELARQALLVLAEDPPTRAAIVTMAAQPAIMPQKLDFAASLAITTVALIVLQTHCKFERHKDGTWTLKLEKKPTSETILKGLVQKLLGYTK
jgi:hypothetical protein